jgi:hypothetical protein
LDEILGKTGDMAYTKNKDGEREELIRCAACEDYIKSSDGFYCPGCKKGPLCRKHRLAGRRECLSCTIDLKLREMSILKQQEKNIKSFIRFVQFLFLVFSILFIAIKFNLAEEISFLQNNLITESLLCLGIGSIVLFGIFSVVLLIQRSKIVSIESAISGIEVRR